jgi:hypothetical protein
MQHIYAQGGYDSTSKYTEQSSTLGACCLQQLLVLSTYPFLWLHGNAKRG